MTNPYDPTSQNGENTPDKNEPVFVDPIAAAKKPNTSEEPSVLIAGAPGEGKDFNSKKLVPEQHTSSQNPVDPPAFVANDTENASKTHSFNEEKAQHPTPPPYQQAPQNPYQQNPYQGAPQGFNAQLPFSDFVRMVLLRRIRCPPVLS